jgi:hypothetical protein
VSCSVHDVVRLEERGVPTAAVGTEPFVDEALQQARALGMPDYRMVLIEHPIQILTKDEVQALADGAFDAIVAHLTAPPAGG